jgi:hypothetical protein
MMLSVVEWIDVYSLPRDMLMEIYMVYLFLYGICIASHLLHWHMELCREPMVPTVPVQHCLLGITKQLHSLLGMKIGDMALHCVALHLYYDFGVFLGV